MQYRKIANTPLDVSGICLGGVALSAPDDLAGVFSLLDHYTEWGGNMIDTANVYGKWFPGNRSTSERNIGAWLHRRNRRHDVLIASKGGHPDLSAMAVPRLTKADVARDLDESLQNLQTDFIDLYWLHRDDPAQPVEAMLDYLGGFVREGKIRAFGCSNWQPGRVAEAMRLAAAQKIPGFCANQLMWSLAVPNREALGDMVAMDEANRALHKESQLPVFAYMSLANGLFSKLADGTLNALDGRLRKLYENEANLARFDKARRLAGELGVSATAVSVCYLLNQKDFLTIPIAGCRTVSQLEDIMAAADVVLDEATLLDLVN
jgi:aryl-alcohol dehydrogenase-like predicted oxidoreductase